MRILNLYAGLGGNRKLWGDDHEITAVEHNPEVASIYKDLFPADRVEVADAHQYLLDHYREFDFIWSSPPCPSHSRARFSSMVSEKEWVRNRYAPVYPDMRLYQEIIFLKSHFKGKFCVENVISYYKPLIPPVIFGGHFFWVNFPMPQFAINNNRGHTQDIDGLANLKGFDLSKYDIPNKRLLLRNCVKPELGKHILDWAIHPWNLNKQLFAA